MSQTLLQTAISRNAHASSGRRFFLLFVLLLVFLIVYPYIETSRFIYLLFRVLGAAVVLLCVYAVSFRRSLLVIALVLAIPALLQRILFSRADAGSFIILNTALSFVFDVFVVTVIFRRIFARDESTSETIYGALCIYLLLGFGFASLYGALARLQPRSFYLDPLSNTHTVPRLFDFVYYSFATMTSVGATGIVPVTDNARSLSVIEAILGVLYLAVLISRLITTYRRSPG
ncbi:MAG TPA: ion channel [Terriglobales bacterium]|nr:ion channel [Terriglobales bacterium]